MTLFGGSMGSFDSGKGVEYLLCLGTGWCRPDENQSPKWKWLVNPHGKFLNILERPHAKKIIKSISS